MSDISRVKNGKRVLSMVDNSKNKKRKIDYNQEIDLFTPVKVSKATHPQKVLEISQSPSTPPYTRKMLNIKQNTIVPKRDMDALHLADLMAIKLDPESYNSYLYCGQMTIPGDSIIVVQDQIRAANTSFRVPIAKDFDANTLRSPIKLRKKGKNHQHVVIDDDLSDFDHEDVEVLQASTNGIFNHITPDENSYLQNTSTFSVDDSSDEDTAPQIDQEGNEIVKPSKLKDVHEISLHDERVARRHMLMAEEQRRLGISLDDSFSKSISGMSPNTSLSLLPSPALSTTQSNISAVLQHSNVSLHSQIVSSDSRQIVSNPGSDVPDTTVKVCVKYPLMGVMNEWKDSFQTIAEETELYKRIETWRCPYLLRFYGSHGPGIVFEYVDGVALDEALSAETSQVAHQKWLWSDLGEHIATALLYLHKRKISHNDLKPENVRYSESQKIWKLLDLGLSTDISAKVCKKIGTDGYRAPEVEQTGVLNFKSDVYGFGIMMKDAFISIKSRYHMLANFYLDNKHLLGTSTGPSKTSSEELEDEILEGGKLWLSLELLMKNMIERCLSPKPETRPSITRLVNFFISLRNDEKIVAEAHANIMKHYV